VLVGLGRVGYRPPIDICLSKAQAGLGLPILVSERGDKASNAMFMPRFPLEIP
jgi:hypothetical protein